MEKQGYVSIWGGKCTSESTFEKYIEGQYNDDGDYLQSSFEKEFALFMEEDFIEAEVLSREHKNIKSLLQGFSYEDTIIMNLKEQDIELKGSCNAIIMLYNYKYGGQNKFVNKEYLNLRFIGSVKYE